jgi:hypothetical protein
VEAFDAPAMTPPATMPDAFSEAETAARPVLIRGREPRAGVLLLEIDVQGVEAA